MNYTLAKDFCVFFDGSNKKKLKMITKFNYFLNENVDDNLNDNFKKWFDNSKVVYNGKPLPVYHGSQSEFEEFEVPSFFTDDYMNADGYAGGEYVYEVYLSLKNPFILDCLGRKWDDLIEPYYSTQYVIGYVNKNKYDGIIFNNVKDSWIDDVDYQDPSTIYVAFNSEQIKSTDNDGTWDIDDKNIYS